MSLLSITQYIVVSIVSQLYNPGFRILYSYLGFSPFVIGINDAVGFKGVSSNYLKTNEEIGYENPNAASVTDQKQEITEFSMVTGFFTIVRPKIVLFFDAYRKTNRKPVKMMI